MRSILLLTFGSSLLFPALAANVPDFTAQTAQFHNQPQVKIIPPPHHHFNLQAPFFAKQSESGKKLAVTSQLPMQLLFNSAGADEINVSAYMCDDAKTYCEKKELHFKLSQLSHGTVDESVKLESSHAKEHASRLPNFIYNEPQKALELAKSSHRPLIIEFFGIWCPPCNMLDASVFSTSSFQKESQNFVKLKLDADQSVSWDLKQKYKITGYPTVIFARDSGEEISRITGLRTKETFIASLRAAYRNKDVTIESLVLAANNGDKDAAYRAGLYFLDREEFDKALPLLESANNPKPKNQEIRTRLWQARVGSMRLKRSQDSKALEKMLSDAIRETDLSVPQFNFAQDLATLTNSRAHLEQVATIARSLIKNDVLLREEELTKGDLYQILGDTYKSLGNETQSKTFYLNAVKEYRKSFHASGSTTEKSRGYLLEIANCLHGAGKSSEAEAVYQDLEAKYPAEFTFHFSHARLLKDLNRIGMAEQKAKLAYDASYGDNRLRAATLLAEIWSTQGKKDQAKALAQDVLSSLPAPSDPANRSQRYRAKLSAFTK